MAHLRDVREGKGEKERGWDAYIWLAQKHPRTLLVNLPEVVKVHFATTLCHILCASLCDTLSGTPLQCICCLRCCAITFTYSALHPAIPPCSRGHSGLCLKPCMFSVQVGFWKDLLQLLQRLSLGERGWTSAAKEEAARKLSSGSNRKQRRLAKQKRLHEWQASLRRAADPEKAAQQEAAGKAASRPAHRMGPHRRQRELLAAEKRAAQAAEQEDDSDDSDAPSTDGSSLSGGKRKAPETAMTAEAPQNGECSCISFSSCHGSALLSLCPV